MKERDVEEGREEEEGREAEEEGREAEEGGGAKEKKRRKNQSPKGIMRSAVPLPCFFDVVKSQEGNRATALTGDKVL